MVLRSVKKKRRPVCRPPLRTEPSSTERKRTPVYRTQADKGLPRSSASTLDLRRLGVNNKTAGDRNDHQPRNLPNCAIGCIGLLGQTRLRRPHPITETIARQEKAVTHRITATVLNPGEAWYAQLSDATADRVSHSDSSPGPSQECGWWSPVNHHPSQRSRRGALTNRT